LIFDRIWKEKLDVLPIFEQNFYFANFISYFRFSIKISISEQNWICHIFPSNFNGVRKFRFSIKISIFGQNFYCRPNFRFSIKISICDEKFRFSMKNFDFWSKFRFSIKISIFDLICDQNCDFRSKFRFSIKISIFDQNFNFRRYLWSKFQFSTLFVIKISTIIENKISISQILFHIFAKISIKISISEQNVYF